MTQAKRISSLLLSLAILATIPLVWWQRQDIMDWWRLHDYAPPTQISQIATTDTMTDYGRKLFYVHHPELKDRSTFRQHCTVAEASIVLGCYITHDRIFILDVQDPRLQGVHEVTAAHEMLHAAYDRLSQDERDKINVLTEQVFASSTDERLIETIAAYKERDAEVVPNELHSILGTEVANLPPELEAYYQRYFADRSSIVKLSKQYESAFTELQNKVKVYDAKIVRLRGQIEAEEARLQQRSAELDTESRRLDQLAAQNRVNEYNSSYQAFNADVRDYNNSVANVKTMIAEFNRLVSERNAIATEENELIEAIDTRIDTRSNR